MKIALVSDIHANARALKRVLDDMPAVDRILCAGDVISDYRFCPDTVELMRQVNATCIQGNHEHSLFWGRNPGYLQKLRGQHSAELLDMLALAPTSFELEAAGAKLLMIHATPWDPFQGYIYPASPMLPRIALLPYDFVVLGHTHVGMVEKSGGVTVINPGSTSEPRDRDRRGSYAVLDMEQRAVTLHRVQID